MKGYDVWPFGQQVFYAWWNLVNMWQGHFDLPLQRIEFFNKNTSLHYHLFAELHKRFYLDSRIYLPNPSWSNHHNIWRDAHVPQRTFHYYHHNSKRLNFGALMDDVKNAPDGSFFLLHPCAHNPNGDDLSDEQWQEISSLFKVLQVEI